MMKKCHGSLKMVDNDNEPRFVAYPCWLPNLFWWVCSSMPGGSALVFDSILMNFTLQRARAWKLVLPLVLTWCVTVGIRKFQGPHLKLVLQKKQSNENAQISSLKNKIFFFWKKKVPLLNSAWETIWTRIFINQINYFPRWKQTRHSVRLNRYLSKAILITTFSFFLTVSSEVPCLTFEYHMFLSGWGC